MCAEIVSLLSHTHRPSEISTIRMKIRIVANFQLTKELFKRNTVHLIALRGARAMMINVMAAFEHAKIGPSLLLAKLEARIGAAFDHAT